MNIVRLSNYRGDFVGPRPTYRVIGGQVVVPAGTTPFILIAASAARVVRINRIRIMNASLTAAQLLRITINRVSALPTGGTPVSPTKVTLDTQAPASNATVQHYTAAPTTGTIMGAIAEVTINGLTTGATANADEKIIDFGMDLMSELPTLRGAAEGVTISFASAPATAVTISYTIEYTEDGN
jgi:hypothetical protein